MLGLRAAKGLEFSDIVILDFFSSLSDCDYKAWKELLSDAQGVQGLSRSQYNFPQLEPQLKLLYTAIMRSINRLIFVESQPSRIGGIFFRWLKAHALADSFVVYSAAESDSLVSTGATLMTRDEWKMRGIDTDLQQASQMLEQAAMCFQRAEEPVLRAAALAHAALKQAEENLAPFLALADDTSTIILPGGAEASMTLSATEQVALAAVLVRGLRVGLRAEVVRLCIMIAYQQLLPKNDAKYFLGETASCTTA